MIVLDTNVLSELMKPAPAPSVEAWAASRPASSLFTTTVTQAEILFGAALLPIGRRRQMLDAAIRGLFETDMAGRVLAFDSAAAREYAGIAAQRRRAGRPISQFDAQIAAIARSRNAAVATRNQDDFAGCGIEVVNPWNTAG